jgi:Domain of unknown function (DUF6134)
MYPRYTLLAFLFSVAGLQAGEEERRTFAISVDGKSAGTHTLIIQTKDDKSVIVTAQADVTVRVAVIRYTYSFRGTEIWKDGKLHQLSTTTNDNGKKHSVTADATKEGLAVKADGRDTQIRGEPWVTTYWKLPAEKQRGPNVGLLDADTGKLISAKLEKIGIEKVTALGKAVECTHWRLTGGVAVDLWYDGSDRLVRQESIEEGHRTILELTRLLRE